MMAEAQEEENIIKEYFNTSFKYEEIIEFLSKNHSITTSIVTVKRCLKQYSLQQKIAEYDIDLVREEIRTILDGPGCSAGYRHICHMLKLQGISVPRSVVRNLIKQLDPERVQERKAHTLQRRTYVNRGPNDVWHCDGYDKLKPFGFPIYASIDGWSRKILWLYVTRSNNLPQNIAAYYLEAVRDLGGCPIKLVTDLGTKNCIMASLQPFFQDDIHSHHYVPSPRNQRIEAWWSYFRRSRNSWWINFFKDL